MSPGAAMDDAKDIGRKWGLSRAPEPAPTTAPGTTQATLRKQETKGLKASQ